MTPTRFGIIGCSRIAERSVIPAIMKSDFAELEIIGSRNIENAKHIASKFNCKKFGTYNDVISDESVDAVYISTPIGTHEEWAINASTNGKHVYCEKSSTTSFQSAKKMIENAKQNNVRIMEGFMFRFHPQHKKVKELISKDKIGDIISFEGKFGFPSFPEGDIRYVKELGGGFLNDSACYPISASRMIFEKEPIGVSCNLSIDSNLGVDIRGSSVLLFEEGKTASVTYGNGNYYQSNYNIWGSKGIISLDRAYSVPVDFETKVKIHYSLNHDWNSRKVDNYKINPTDHFLEMIDDFCSDIQNKEKSQINFEKELENQAKVMEAHRLSNQEKRFVKIDEIQ